MIVSAALVAGGCLVLSGAIVWAALRTVKSFGDYAEALRDDTKARERTVSTMLAVHESLQMLSGDNAKLWAAIQKAKRNGHNEEVA